MQVTARPFRVTGPPFFSNCPSTTDHVTEALTSNGETNVITTSHNPTAHRSIPTKTFIFQVMLLLLWSSAANRRRGRVESHRA